MAMDTGNARVEKNLLLLLERTRDVYGYIPDDAVMGLADHWYSGGRCLRCGDLLPGSAAQAMGKHLVKVCKSVPATSNTTSRY